MDKTGKEWIYKKTLKDIGVDVYDFRQETEQIECYKKWDDTLFEKGVDDIEDEEDEVEA